MSIEIESLKKTAEDHISDLEEEAMLKNKELTETQIQKDIETERTFQDSLKFGEKIMNGTVELLEQMNNSYLNTMEDAKSDNEKGVLALIYILLVIPVLLSVFLGGSIMALGSVLAGLCSRLGFEFLKEKLEGEKVKNVNSVEQKKKELLEAREKMITENSLMVQELLSDIEDEIDLELEGYKLMFKGNSINDVDYAVLEKHLADELDFFSDYLIDTEKESIATVSAFDEYFDPAKKIFANLKIYREKTFIKHLIKINKMFAGKDLNQFKHLFLLKKAEAEERYNKLCKGDLSHIVTLQGTIKFKPNNYYKDMYCTYMNISPDGSSTNTRTEKPDTEEDEEQEM